MYLALTTNGVGKVENGQITEMYSSNATIKEVVDGNAEKSESDRIGDRVTSTELVKVIHRGDEYKIQDTLGDDQSATLKPTTELSNLQSKAKESLVL